MSDILERVKDLFRQRKHAYQTVFTSGPIVDVVLRDLAKFCRAHESTFHVDARLHATLEGRREVWLRIQEQLKLSSDELWELHEQRKKGRV